MAEKDYSVEFFGSFSREAMKILLHMILQRERNKGLFTTEELGRAAALKGRSVSGSLSSFSKRAKTPIVIKAGTADTNWNGQRFNRPKQLWMINPKLTDDDITAIKDSLLELLSSEIWCPWCGYTSTQEWSEATMRPSGSGHICPQCGADAVEELYQQSRGN